MERALLRSYGNNAGEWGLDSLEHGWQGLIEKRGQMYDITEGAFVGTDFCIKTFFSNNHKLRENEVHSK